MKKALPNLFTLSLLFVFTSNTHAQLPAYVPTSNIEAWYPMNGNSNDASGSGNTATNFGATFINDRNGVATSAASFNGSSAYMSVATPTFTFSSTGSFSYSFWINKQTQPGAGIVLMTGSNVADNFITLFQGATNQQFGTNKQQQPWVWAVCPQNLNIWTHYVATYNAGVMNLFKNAALQSTATFSYTGVNSVNLPFYIGQGFSGGNFMGGIDDVGVWSRVLTNQEVVNLYNGTPTGVNNLQADTDFAVTLNADQSQLTITSPAAMHGNTFYLLCVDGKQHLTVAVSHKQTTVNISSLSSGLYFMSSGKNKAVKFVVTR